MQIARRGILFVLSSPSGAGKTSIARRLLEVENNTDVIEEIKSAIIQTKMIH